jgi:hypothetical protein
MTTTSEPPDNEPTEAAPRPTPERFREFDGLEPGPPPLIGGVEEPPTRAELAREES